MREYEILKFIDSFKEVHCREVENLFLNGHCYWFAKILEIRFNGTIYFDPKEIHFATEIDNHMYDITGMLYIDTDWYEWDEYKIYNNVESIVSSCILKDN